MTIKTAPPPRLITTPADLRRELAAARARGAKIGLVPTMGALHEGHLSLVDACKRDGHLAVVTVFVNPAQFGPGEDFTRYPRVLDADLALLGPRGAELVFAPETGDVYRSGHATYIEMGGPALSLEGEFRPGHFRGVATIVLKLFNLVQPDKAYFGRKDFQQSLVVRKLVADLNLPIDIVVCPTVRDSDGLAASSRNAYLSPAERARALAISRSLAQARQMVAAGRRDAAAIKTMIEAQLRAADLAIDYVAICDSRTLAPLERIDAPAVALVAVRAGTTRLIDNELLEGYPLMWQTLFVIPKQIAGVDVFGFGWVLALWSAASAVVVGWSLWRNGWNAETRSRLGAAIVVALVVAFVLPSLVDPVLGGVAIRGYGLMLLISVVSGVGLGVYRAQRVGLDPELMLSLATWLFVAGILGARVFYIVEYWENFQRPTLAETLFAMVNLTQGGLVVYGSLLAGGAALVAFIYKHNLPGLALTDLIGPGVVLGVGLGRLGCFLNGCCYGGLTDLPWAVQFPPESPAYADQVERGLLYVQGLIFAGSGHDPAVIERVEPGSPAERQGLKPGERVTAVDGVPVASVGEAQLRLLHAFGQGREVRVAVAGDPAVKSWTISGPQPRTLAVHPTQLYSFIDAMLLLAVILLFEPYKRWDGEITALGLTLHPISRFLLEVIRVDESAVFGTGMSISQNISIAIFIGGVGLWIYLLARRPKPLAWQSEVALQG